MEQQFLTNIAQALGRKEPLTKAPKREGLGPPAFWLEQKHFNDKTLELFKDNWEALTGRFTLAKNSAQAQKQIKEWLQELNSQQIICWDHEELKKYIKPEELGVKVTYWKKDSNEEELIQEAQKTEVGLTWADFGVAYTGTLALFAAPNKGRTVSLLPNTHIAVLKKSQIVATMSIVIDELEKRKTINEMPSCVNFISGPSRSADIEMDLSIGVHGPYRTWLVVLDE